MRHLYNTILLCLTMMLMASCDGMPTDNILLHSHSDQSFVMTSMRFSEDYSKMTIRTDALKDYGVNMADSSKVDIEINDTYCDLVPMIRIAQPKVESIKLIGPELARRSGLSVLVLVDMSQPTAILKKQMEYVKSIQRFCRDNLYIAFMMPDGKVTPIAQATDYIINNYINFDSPLLRGTGKHLKEISDSETIPEKEHILLYRSVSKMLYNISGHARTVFDNVPKKALIVFSDGQVYDEATDMPLDPEHFTIQEHLINQSRNMPTNTSVYYVNLANSHVNASVKDANMMRMLCTQSGGMYLTSFNWPNLRNKILNRFNIPSDDYEIVLRNPEGKMYFGCRRSLSIQVYKNGTKDLIAECNKEYHVGSIHQPVIIGEKSYLPIYITGIFIAFIIIGLTYIILQVIVPYIQYRIFRNKYVVKYTGENMSVEGHLVANTCYFCKAPFEVGDTIVAKCQHTMHEECWNENDHHCPEHGKHCPEGSHYYDPLNILNPRNGSYVIKWLIPSIVVSCIAWLIMVHSDREFLLATIDKICELMKGTGNNDTLSGVTPELGYAIMSISPRMYLLPLFGLYLASLFTLLFAWLAGYHRQWRYRILDMAVRALIVQVLSMLIFFTEFLIVLVNDIYDGSILFDWIPWAFVTYLILYVSTKDTRIHDLHNRTMCIVSLAMGITNAVLWNMLGTYETKNQITLFILLFILYGAVLAVTIARQLPASEMYFLHVKGEIKEMDIALYKWLRQTPEAFVTIGRSVDCQLQISWDSDSDIAPVHAIIRHHIGIPYISSVDGDVYIDNKPIAEGEKVRLHHGMTFCIGTTAFTFIEA